MKDCSGRGFTYFALTPNYCRCGNPSPHSMDQWKRQPYYCNAVCPGDSNAKCGRVEWIDNRLAAANVYQDPCRRHPGQTKRIADPYDPTCRKWIDCSNGVFEDAGTCNDKLFHPLHQICAPSIPSDLNRCHNGMKETTSTTISSPETATMSRESHDYFVHKYIGCFRDHANNGLDASTNSWIGDRNLPQRYLLTIKDDKARYHNL